MGRTVVTPHLGPVRVHHESISLRPPGVGGQPARTARHVLYRGLAEPRHQDWLRRGFAGGALRLTRHYRLLLLRRDRSLSPQCQ